MLNQTRAHRGIARELQFQGPGITTSTEYVSRAGKLRALAVTTMSRAALLQRPSMQSPKSDRALITLCAGLFAAGSASFRSSGCTALLARHPPGSKEARMKKALASL